MYKGYTTTIRIFSNKNNKENEKDDSSILLQMFRKLLLAMKSCCQDRVVSFHNVYSHNSQRVIFQRQPVTADLGIKKHVLHDKIINNSIILQTDKEVIHLLSVTHWLRDA